MFLSPIAGINYYPLEAVANKFAAEEPNAETINTEETENAKPPTFLDVFQNILKDAAETTAQKNADMINLMIGDTEDLDVIQANITKAEIAVELLVNVKNAVVDAYNELIRMSI